MSDDDIVEYAPTCCGRTKRALCYQPAKPMHKNELKSRWSTMLLLCMGLASSYYAFDIPSATETALQSAFLGSGTGPSDTCVNGTNIPAADNAAADAFNNNFNLLYSVYAWPNVALPFFGGFLADRMGVRLMGVVFQGLLFIGAVVTALGSSYIHANTNAAWGTMFVGRTIFGFGGESLSVVQSAMIASYFQGKELAFALGVNLALARMGSVLNNEISAVIASNAPVAIAFWVGAAIVGLGFISMVAVFYLDLKAENTLRASIGKRPLKNAGLFASFCKLLTCCCRKKPQAQHAKIASAAGTINNRALLEDGSLDRPSTLSIDEKALATAVYGLDSAPPSPAMPVKTSVAAAAAHAAGSATGDGHVLHQHGGQGEDDSLLDNLETEPSEEIHLGDVLHFPMIYWALVLSCVTVYIDVLAFNNNASTFIQQKFLANRPLWQICDNTKQSYYVVANTIQSTVYACGAVITPFIGSFTDMFGLRAILNVVAAGAITGVHAVLAFTNVYPAVPLVFLGAAYSLYAAALWPCVALVIEPKSQATAYGLVTAVQNLGQAVAPLGIAALMPDARCSTFQTCVDGWDNVERLFVWIGCAGVGCGIALNIVDRCVSKHPVLNESNAALVKRQREEAAAEIENSRLPLLEAGKGGEY